MSMIRIFLCRVIKLFVCGLSWSDLFLKKNIVRSTTYVCTEFFVCSILLRLTPDDLAKWLTSKMLGVIDFKAVFHFTPYRSETSSTSLFHEHSDRTNDMDTKENATVRYNTFEVENGL